MVRSLVALCCTDDSTGVMFPGVDSGGNFMIILNLYLNVSLFEYY